MINLHFPFYIENKSIKIIDDYYNHLLYIQRLLQCWFVGKYERINNLQNSGLLNNFLFKNMNTEEKSILSRSLKSTVNNQENSIEVTNIEIYSKEELKLKNYNVNSYTENTYFILVTFLIKDKNITVNSLITSTGEIFKSWEGI